MPIHCAEEETVFHHLTLILQATTLKNGIYAVSRDLKSPIATIAIAVNAGSLHETSQTLGATAYLKALAFQVLEQSLIDF